MTTAKLLQYARLWKSTAKEALGHCILFAAHFLSILHVTETYIFSPTLVYGPSMLPTLNLTGDVLLVEKLSPRLGKVGPGDVVLVRSPENPRKTITKHVVGDTVTFLVDPGWSDRSHSLVVPKGHVWIQGDNIHASNDSRHVGPIPYGLVLGKVFCRHQSSFPFETGSATWIYPCKGGDRDSWLTVTGLTTTVGPNNNGVMLS